MEHEHRVEGGVRIIGKNVYYRITIKGTEGGKVRYSLEDGKGNLVSLSAPKGIEHAVSGGSFKVEEVNGNSAVFSYDFPKGISVDPFD